MLLVMFNGARGALKVFGGLTLCDSLHRLQTTLDALHLGNRACIRDWFTMPTKFGQLCAEYQIPDVVVVDTCLQFDEIRKKFPLRLPPRLATVAVSATSNEETVVLATRSVEKIRTPMPPTAQPPRTRRVTVRNAAITSQARSSQPQSQRLQERALQRSVLHRKKQRERVEEHLKTVLGEEEEDQEDEEENGERGVSESLSPSSSSSSSSPTLEMIMTPEIAREWLAAICGGLRVGTIQWADIRDEVTELMNLEDDK
jgi:hypothetical protein